MGRALLAFSGAEPTEEVLSQPLPSLTPHSITDPVRLRTALEKIQASGPVHEELEAALEVSRIAAPVFAGGTAVAALPVAVPRSRYRPARLPSTVRTADLSLPRVIRGGVRPGKEGSSCPSAAAITWQHSVRRSVLVVTSPSPPAIY